MDGEVAAVALKVLRRHPGYLTPKTVVLSLCSDLVADDIKSEMTSKILSVSRPSNFEVGSNKTVVIDDKVPLSPANLTRTPGSCSKCLISRATGSKSTRKSGVTAQNM